MARKRSQPNTQHTSHSMRRSSFVSLRKRCTALPSNAKCIYELYGVVDVIPANIRVLQLKTGGLWRARSAGVFIRFQQYSYMLFGSHKEQPRSEK